MLAADHASGTLKITSASDLRGLDQDARTRRRRRARAIVLDLPGINADEQRQRERRISRAYFACGCAEATVLGFAALLAAIGWLALGNGGFGAATWTSWLWPLAAFAAGTGVGKWLGLAWARIALRREINDLIATSGLRLEPPSDPTQAKAMCAVN